MQFCLDVAVLCIFFYRSFLFFVWILGGQASWTSRNKCLLRERDNITIYEWLRTGRLSNSLLTHTHAHTWTKPHIRQTPNPLTKALIDNFIDDSPVTYQQFSSFCLRTCCKCTKKMCREPCPSNTTAAAPTPTTTNQWRIKSTPWHGWKNIVNRCRLFAGITATVRFRERERMKTAEHL